MAEVDSAVVTLGVTARAVATACSWVYYTSTTSLGRRIVGQLSAKRVDASLVTEEEARVVRVKTTAFGVASTDTSDNMAFTAFEVKVWRSKRISK